MHSQVPPPADPSVPESILVVVPTFNECDNIESLTTSVLRTIHSAQILIVDDNSPDGTGLLASEIARKEPRVHVLHKPRKEGLGRAYVDGFSWGLARDFSTFFEMDADHSHDPAALPSFLQALRGGADLVIGSRNIPGGAIHGWGLGRHLLSKGGSLYSRLLLGVPIRDLTSGFKAYRRRTLEQLDLSSIQSDGYSFQIETTYRALQRGLRVVEIPIVFTDRRAGSSKMNRTIFLEAVTIVWKLKLWNTYMLHCILSNNRRSF